MRNAKKRAYRVNPSRVNGTAGCEPADREPPDREYIAGLDKGLAVIEAFGAGRERLTQSEVARVVGLSPASARRCLRTLEALGYACVDGRYWRLTPRVLRLGHAYVSSSPLARQAQPVLESLAERTHASASLGMLDGADVVFVARATARRSLSGGIGPGTRLPAASAATGRVLLAALPEAQVARLLAQSPCLPLTPRTVVSPQVQAALIAQARERGYATSDEELELGLRSIAVPIRDRAGRVVAAMSLAARTDTLPAEQPIERLLPELEAARRTLGELG